MPPNDTTNGGWTTNEVAFTPKELERLNAVADEVEDVIHEATMARVELYEAIDYTQDGGFQGPRGFAKIKDDTYPTWPLGSLLGIETVAVELNCAISTASELLRRAGSRLVADALDRSW